MKNKKFVRSKDAVAGVIEALLLVALVAMIISTIQLVYIPQMMEQRESDHMDDVENQFSYLKSIIDLQSTVKEDVPISSPIILGSRELPYFVTARAFGQVNIIDRYNTDSKIDINPPPAGLPSGNIPLTSIKYKAHNSYFVDQTYALEGGCVIVKQPDGETVKLEPAINIKNESKINIICNIPVIAGVPGKNSTSGYKNCFVRTNYSGTDTYSGDISGFNSFIRIYTDYPDAWNASLNRLLEEEVKNGYVNVTITQDLGGIDVVEIEPWGKTIHLELTVTYIGAQIGPGTVIV